MLSRKTSTTLHVFDGDCCLPSFAASARSAAPSDHLQQTSLTALRAFWPDLAKTASLQMGHGPTPPPREHVAFFPLLPASGRGMRSSSPLCCTQPESKRRRAPDMYAPLCLQAFCASLQLCAATRQLSASIEWQVKCRRMAASLRVCVTPLLIPPSANHSSTAPAPGTGQWNRWLTWSRSL